MFIQKNNKLKTNSISNCNTFRNITSTSSLILKETIDQVWLFLCNYSNYSILSSLLNSSTYFEQEENFNNLNVLIENISRIIDKYTETHPNKKIISWKFPSISKINSFNKYIPKIKIKKTCILYRISDGDKTLVKIISKINKNVNVKKNNNTTNIDKANLENFFNEGECCRSENWNTSSTKFRDINYERLNDLASIDKNIYLSFKSFNDISTNNNNKIPLNFKLEFFENFKSLKSEKQQSQEIISHESCLIKSKFLDTWNFVTHPEKVSQIIPIIGSKFQSLGEPLKVGTFWKFLTQKEKKFLFLKVNSVYTGKKRNCWIYGLELIGTEKFAQMQNILIKVIKVGENYSHVSVTHFFKSSANKNYMKVIGFNKIDALKKLKKFLEQSNKNEQ